MGTVKMRLVVSGNMTHSLSAPKAVRDASRVAIKAMQYFVFIFFIS